MSTVAAQILDESRIGDGGGVHPHDFDALARGQPGDGAEHGHAVIAAGVDHPAAQPAAAVHGEAVVGGLDVGAEAAQAVDNAGDAV